VDIVTAVQTRTFSEEVEEIEKLGGVTKMLEMMQTNPKTGVNEDSLESRSHFFGSNEKANRPLKSIFMLLMEALDDFTLKILIVASFVSIIVEMIVAVDHRETAWIEGFAILCAVIISSFITTLNNYQKQE